MKKAIYSLMFIGIMLISTLASAGTTNIVITGSNTVFPIVDAWAGVYQEENSDISFDVTGPGSGAGIAALIDGQCDLAPMSRAPKQSEIDEATGKGMNLSINVVGLDALVVIVNHNNPLESLTSQQVTDIFNGTVTNWADLGWSAGGAILVKERDENSGTHDYFNEHFLDGEEVDPSKVNGHAQYSSTSQLFGEVAGADGAIGYGGLAYLDNTVKAVKIDNVAATKANAADGTYSVARELYIVYDTKTVIDEAKAFVDFGLSPEGQYYVDFVGYIAIGEISDPEAGEEETPISSFMIFSGLLIAAVAFKSKRKTVI